MSEKFYSSDKLTLFLGHNDIVVISIELDKQTNFIAIYGH